MPNQINLSPTQTEFALLLDNYPWLSKYWNWEKRECRYESLKETIGVISHSEQILARFFLSLWTHKNHDFDILEAASVLDKKDRIMISTWLSDPIWP